MKAFLISFLAGLTTLMARYRAPTPAFWQKVQKRAAAAGISLAVVMASPYTPAAVLPWLQYLAFACALAVAISQFTCDSPSNPEQSAS